eukprot:CAMPEP_0114514520 /NCGR_PEP_ID=MMETSP0109-20121206/16199_1 /TAXON_ID=29199 /ORGANISM="Chlorarachnion reptans, Strain CCCM449" /LENGTH=498 /DNA_ID=CAMNT_0001694569 /DNA_START=187 /DNA_END=1683 /DNA_ORIENTATION=-
MLPETFTPRRAVLKLAPFVVAAVVVFCMPLSYHHPQHHHEKGGLRSRILTHPRSLNPLSSHGLKPTTLTESNRLHSCRKNEMIKSQNRKNSLFPLPSFRCRCCGSVADDTQCNPETRGVRIRGKPIKGKNKYLGASAFGSAIIGIPSHASSVLKVLISPGEECRVTTFGNLPRGKKYQWLRGQPHGQYIYGIPCWADRVVKIDPIREEIETFRSENIAEEGGTWQWHGGCLGTDGNIYGIPCNALKVLKINPKAATFELIGEDLPGQNKFYGGIEGRDGCIYGIPYADGRVLRINPDTQKVSLVGGPFPKSAWNWHGGVRAPDGSIIGVPSHAHQVLKISTPSAADAEDDDKVEVRFIGERYSGRYKWGGACVGLDERVYCIPSDINKVLRVDPVSEKTELLEIEGGGSLLGLKNLWQGAVMAPNGHIFAMPCNAEAVLRIIPETGKIDLIGKLPKGNDKWQGGALGVDGNIYGIPQNAEYVLQIKPDTGEINMIGLS